MVLSMFELFLKSVMGKMFLKASNGCHPQDSVASLCTPWQPLGPQHLEPLRCCPVSTFLRPCPSYLGRISMKTRSSRAEGGAAPHPGWAALLMQLESRWRQHFLDSMQPRHLPQQWVGGPQPSEAARYGRTFPSSCRNRCLPSRLGRLGSWRRGCQVTSSCFNAIVKFW